MFHKIKANICPPHSISAVSNESGSNTALVGTVVLGERPKLESAQGPTGTGGSASRPGCDYLGQPSLVGNT